MLAMMVSSESSPSSIAAQPDHDQIWCSAVQTPKAQLPLARCCVHQSALRTRTAAALCHSVCHYMWPGASMVLCARSTLHR